MKSERELFNEWIIGYQEREGSTAFLSFTWNAWQAAWAARAALDQKVEQPNPHDCQKCKYVLRDVNTEPCQTCRKHSLFVWPDSVEKTPSAVYRMKNSFSEAASVEHCNEMHFAILELDERLKKAGM